MSTAKFVLKEPDSKLPTLIYLMYSLNGQRLKYSTGEKILPKYWNFEKQRVREVRDLPECLQINELLDKLASNIKQVHRDLINRGEAPSLGKLRELLDRMMFRNEHAPKAGLFKFIEELIDSTNRKPNTLRQWKQTYRKLQEYKNATKRELDFDSIDLGFYDSFVGFLTKEGYTKNSIGGFVKNVKVFMNEAVGRNLTKNYEYRNRKFKVVEEQVDKVYLTQAELQRLNELDLSNSPKLDRVRDLFLVGCYTGLRFSDLIQVKTANIMNEGRQIRVKTEKTGEVVVIPLHPIVRAIIAKYEGELPPVISNQKMNDYLKELAKLADIQEETEVAITRGGSIERNSKKKYELITTHTARRSFATNAYLNDIPSISIMKITGHRTEKSFLKYIRISQEDNANKLMNHPFFAV